MENDPWRSWKSPGKIFGINCGNPALNFGPLFSSVYAELGRHSAIRTSTLRSTTSFICHSSQYNIRPINRGKAFSGVRLFVCLFVILYVFVSSRTLTQERMIPKCSNSVHGMTFGYRTSGMIFGLKGQR